MASPSSLNKTCPFCCDWEKQAKSLIDKFDNGLYHKISKYGGFPFCILQFIHQEKWEDAKRILFYINKLGLSTLVNSEAPEAFTCTTALKMKKDFNFQISNLIRSESVIEISITKEFPSLDDDRSLREHLFKLALNTGCSFFVEEFLKLYGFKYSTLTIGLLSHRTDTEFFDDCMSAAILGGDEWCMNTIFKYCPSLYTTFAANPMGLVLKSFNSVAALKWLFEKRLIRENVETCKYLLKRVLSRGDPTSATKLVVETFPRRTVRDVLRKAVHKPHGLERLYCFALTGAAPTTMAKWLKELVADVVVVGCNFPVDMTFLIMSLLARVDRTKHPEGFDWVVKEGLSYGIRLLPSDEAVKNSDESVKEIRYSANDGLKFAYKKRKLCTDSPSTET